MSTLVLGIILALQNGTQDPVVTQEFALSLPPNVCAKKEEIAGSIDFFKTCGNENLSASVVPGRADEVIVKVLYWNYERPEQLLSKKISLAVPCGSGRALVTTGSIPIIPTWVKAIEITLMEKGKTVERQKVMYSRRAPQR